MQVIAISMLLSVYSRNLRPHTGENLYSALKNTHRGEPISVQSMLQPLFIQSELNMYLRTHTGDKPNHCSQCDDSFSRNSDLIMHLRIHSARNHISAGNVTRPFQPTVNLPGIRDHTLGRIFVVQSRIHTGENTYQCSQC